MFSYFFLSIVGLNSSQTRLYYVYNTVIRKFFVNIPVYLTAFCSGMSLPRYFKRKDDLPDPNGSVSEAVSS